MTVEDEGLQSGPAAVSPALQAARPARFGVMDLALLGCAAIWGTNFVVLKVAVVEFQPLVLAAARFGVGTLALLAVILRRGAGPRLSRYDLGQLALLAVAGNAGYQPLSILGLSHTTAGNAALIIASTPALVAVLAHVLHLERLGARAWGGIALSFFGLALVIFGGAGDISLARETLQGDALVLGAALCWAVSTLMTRPLVERMPALTVVTYSNLMSLPLLALMAVPALQAQDWGAIHPTAWTQMIASGLLAVALAYVVWSKGVGLLGGTRTAIYANLIPVVAALTGALFLHERLSLLQVAGAACVLAGIAAARIEA